MNRLGDELFTGSAFAADQNRGARRCHLRNKIEQRQHLVALADDVGKIEALLQRALELHVFIAQPPRFDGLRDLREQFIVGPRLRDVVHRAALERGARHVDRSVSGDENDGKLRIAQTNFSQQIEPVAIGQTYIEQQQVERMLFQLREAAGAGIGAGDAVTFAGQQHFKAFADF